MITNFNTFSPLFVAKNSPKILGYKSKTTKVLKRSSKKAKSGENKKNLFSKKRKRWDEEGKSSGSNNIFIISYFNLMIQRIMRENFMLKFHTYVQTSYLKTVEMFNVCSV